MEILNCNIQSRVITDRYMLGPGAFIRNFNANLFIMKLKKEGSN